MPPHRLTRATQCNDMAVEIAQHLPTRGIAPDHPRPNGAGHGVEVVLKTLEGLAPGGHRRFMRQDPEQSGLRRTPGI